MNNHILRNKVSFLFFTLLVLLFSSCRNERLQENSVTEKQEQSDNQNEVGKQDSTNAELEAFYKKKGLEYAMATQAVLGKNLLRAIKNKGTIGALEFCNSRAYPLTDSMALALNAKIKRVSDKNRNPENAANEMEMKYINLTQELLEKGEKPEAQLSEIQGKMLVYAPIMTNGMCMQCHGQKNTDIAQQTLDKVFQLYPNDKATGYKPNQLRGIWVVEMEKN